MSKLYEINLRESEKILYVKASGFFKEEDAKAYLNELNATINKVNPGYYTLIVDATDQKAVAQNVVEEIRGVLKLYMSYKFKELIVINPSSVTSKIQIHKCAKEVGYNGVFKDTI